MKQKIEWYKEVLELEPGSRVFFPLAKLLAANSQNGEAISTLRQGLLRHPDHVEARLLLVELLHKEHDASALHSEIENLGGIFSLYPGFWKAWSETLADNPALHDAALAMRFFAAALQGKSVSWAGIIEQGLLSLLESDDDEPASVPAFTLPRQSPHEAAAMQQAAASLASSLAAPSPVEEVVAAEEHAPVDEALIEDDEPEEAFSLRTRSMAEVLAEQGDIGGALDIYKELMTTAAPEEKASLSARAEELTARMAAGSEARHEEKASSNGESTRLVSLLESLAQRLEDRAR